MTLEDEIPPATISEIIAMRLVEARRGVTQAQLADRLRGMGVKMDRASIAKIEARAKRSKTKARKVTVEELFLLAAALGVSPLHLVLPLDDQSRVEISPTITRPAKQIRAWVRGQMPLERRDARMYYTEAPPHEFQEILDAAEHHRFAREAAIAAQLEDRIAAIADGTAPPSTASDLVPARYIGSGPRLFATHPGRVIEYGDTVMVTSASLARPDLEAIDIDDSEDEDGSA